MAVALDFYLEIEAEAAQEFSIAATGRDADRCAQLEDNLILETYKQILRSHKRPLVPLAIRMANGIPLGMGCGSSAAARLAAIALAVHFGQLAWSTDRILEEAYRLEGHPDNVAACWLGGFVTAVCEGKSVHVAKVDPPPDWRAIVVFPAEPLATSKARAVLPACYSLARRSREPSIGGCSGTGICAGAGRSAAPGHERPHPSALSRAHLSFVADAAAAGG